MAIQNGRVMYNTSGVQNPLLMKKSVKTTRNGGQRNALDYTLCVPDANVKKSWKHDDYSDKYTFDGYEVSVPVKKNVQGRMQDAKATFYVSSYSKTYHDANGLFVAKGYSYEGSYNYALMTGKVYANKNGAVQQVLDVDALRESCKKAAALNLQTSADFQPQQDGYGNNGRQVDASYHETVHVERNPESEEANTVPVQNADVVVENTDSGKHIIPSLRCVELEEFNRDKKQKADMLAYNSLTQNYNELVDFANAHGWELETEPYTEELRTGDYYKDSLALRNVRDDIFDELVDLCDENDVDKNQLPDINTIHRVVYDKSTGESKSPAEKLMDFNAERGLSLLDGDRLKVHTSPSGQVYTASYAKYALSDAECEALESGEPIVLSGIADDKNQSDYNVVVNLVQLANPDANGKTHMLNVEKQIDVTHPDFKDLYNEGYILHHDDYDMLRHVVTIQEGAYALTDNNRSGNAATAATKKKSASERCAEIHENAGGERVFSKRNYTISKWYDLYSKTDKVIEKSRDASKIAETRHRLLQEPPTKNEANRGFTNRFDAVYFDQHRKAENNLVKKCLEIIDESKKHPELNSKSYLKYIADVTAAKEEADEKLAKYREEETLRRTPVNDERYANMGFANEYEVKVFKDYKEYQGRSNARKTVQGEDSVARFKRLEETLSRRGVAVPSADDDFDFSL